MKNKLFIILQFLAGLFLLLGIKQLYVFFDFDLLELITTMGKESFLYYINRTEAFSIADQLNYLIKVKIILGFLAIFINYIILFYDAYKKKYNWNYSLIITIILSFIHYINLINLPILQLNKIPLLYAYLIPIFMSLIIAISCYILIIRMKMNKTV